MYIDENEHQTETCKTDFEYNKLLEIKRDRQNFLEFIDLKN